MNASRPLTRKQRLTALLLVALLVPAINPLGCITPPIPASGKTPAYGKPIVIADTEKILDGVTTRAEIVSWFGTPTEKFDDQQTAQYAWGRVVARWFTPNGCSGDSWNTEDITRDEMLLIRYNPDGIVVAHKWTKLPSKGTFSRFAEDWSAQQRAAGH